MKSVIPAIMALLVILCFGSCKTVREDNSALKNRTEVSESSTTNTVANETTNIKTETNATDNSVIRIFEETVIKKGDDTTETRRKTTDIRNDKKQESKKEKVRTKVLRINTLTTLQIKEKQIITITKKVSTGVPWWVYFLAGVPFAGAILYIIRLKFF